MNVLFFLLVIVFIYKLFQTFREGFDGNCYKDVFPNFRNSKLKYDEIQNQYDANDDISLFLKETRDTDFSDNNVMVPFNRLMEDEKTLLKTITDYNKKKDSSSKVRDLDNATITNQSVVDLKCKEGVIHIRGGDYDWTVLRKGDDEPYEKLNADDVVKLPCGSMDTDSCTLDYLY
jgi:hypothetical protein